MAIKKVLVVDDSKTELMFMTDLLQKKGFSVKTAENAEDAFRRLAEEKPDLILMDVVMPGKDGISLRSIGQSSSSGAQPEWVFLPADPGVLRRSPSSACCCLRLPAESCRALADMRRACSRSSWRSRATDGSEGGGSLF